MKKLLLVIVLAALGASQSVAQAINVNLTPRQPLTLMGGDMERSAGFLPHATNPQQIADWVYKDIAFTTCRVSFDKQQELIEGVPHFDFYKTPLASMKMVQTARPGVKFWATPKTDYDGFGTENNLPDWIYTGGGYDGGKYDPTKVNVAKFARFLADYLQHMHKNGVPITYLSVAKEWKQVFDAEREAATIDALTALLATPAYQGVPVPLFSGPAGWGVVGTTCFVEDVKAKGFTNRYHGFCAHDYDKPTEDKWRAFIAAVAPTGLEPWNEESDAGSGGPTAGVEPDFTIPLKAYEKRCQWYRQGLRGELFFENWSRGINKETRGVYFTKGGTGTRLRGHYIMQHFANHAADSHYLASTTSDLPGVDTMAFRRGQEIILWVLNLSGTPYANVPITLTGAPLAKPAIARHQWTASTPLPGVETNINRTSPTQFVDTIEGSVIQAYIFTVD